MSNFDKIEEPKPEEYEMCDCCGKSYYYRQIRREQYSSTKTRTLYKVRLCPYCNLQEAVRRLDL